MTLIFPKRMKWMNGYNVEQCVTIANNILKDPVMRMLNDIETEEKNQEQKQQR